MRRRILGPVVGTVFGVVAGAAAAQTVTVRSGEHPGFSRLAFDLPEPGPWRFGRDGAGYALELEGGERLDLSRVWQALGHGRIAGLSGDGPRALRLALGCAPCHATAFESRPGTVVIDVRDGPPPPASRFEQPLAEAVPRPRIRPPVTLAAVPPVRPGYDWTTLPPPERELPLPPTLDPVREAVLRQLAEGAARGVVDMVDRLPPPPPTGALPPQIRMGEEPGFIDVPGAPLTAEGRSCIPDARLDIASWGSAEPVSVALAPARGALEGEFDTPDLAAVDRAIRYHLFLGFGAEARQLAAVYPVPAADRQLYDAMGRILDGDPVTDDVLAPMAGCGGAAALWALLSRPVPHPGEPEQTGAALQAFVALPPHLRRDLAPVLVERFALRQDPTSARIVQDALLRAQPDPDPATRLLVARRAEDGEAELTALVAEGGHSADEALIALAERKLGAGEPLAPDRLVALQALLRERTGGPDEPPLRRLVVLGLAAASAFDAAFDALPGAPEAGPELWSWLARTGGDDSILRHAVLESAAPDLPVSTRVALADRLTDLGLPDPALLWLDARGPEAERLAMARAQIGRRDAREALRLVAGLEGEAAEAIRRAAEAQLSPPDAPPPEAVTLLDPAPPAEVGALAQGRALVSDAAEARARIEALLNATSR